MSEQKTEAPTPRRIREARKEGQVAKSRDLSQACGLLAVTVLLAMGGSWGIGRLNDFMRSCFRPELLTRTGGDRQLLAVTADAGKTFLLVSLPFALVMVLVGMAMTFLQVQPLFAAQAVKPKFDRLNPIAGFRNLFFKAQTYLELAKNFFKFAVLALLIYLVVYLSLGDIVQTLGKPIIQSSLAAWSLLLSFLWKASVVLLALGVADYFLQKKLLVKELKMTKSEVKREYKEEEGDPFIKQARVQLHHEIATQRMLEDIGKADVVVVNPTHIAVALEYDEKAMEAPRILAKGQEHLAQRIKELAREYRVPMVRRIPLARALHRLDVGEEIPEDLYQAVAEVLNWVYQLKQQQASKENES